MSYSMPARLLAEFVGTFFLIAAGLGAFAAGADLLGVAFAHGLAIAIGVTAIGHVSNGHLNPAVTTVMVAFKQLPAVQGLLYVVAQLLGAWVAAMVIAVGWGRDFGDFVGSVPALGDGVSTGGGILLEAVATFLLVFTVFGVAVDKRGAFSAVAGLPIGLTVTASILMIGGATGAALNPARWFGPALMTGTWGDALVWIIGPVVGALIAGAAYMLVIRPSDDA